MCSKLKVLTILADMVPFPEAGAPSISDLKTFVAIIDAVSVLNSACSKLSLQIDLWNANIKSC